jgi:hypothetical protein
LFDERLHLVLIGFALVARCWFWRRDRDGTERSLIRIGKGADLVARRPTQDSINRSPARLPENVEQRYIERTRASAKSYLIVHSKEQREVGPAAIDR